MEPNSNYEHRNTLALGVYKGQPFVTGSETGNLKTEILEETENMGSVSNQWNVVADYPFSRGDR